MQLAETLVDMCASDESEIGVFASFSSNVSMALSALHRTQAIYEDSIMKCGVSVSQERLLGEYSFSLFLNLLSSACKPSDRKYGKELCVFYAGLLIDKVSKYINMTF